MGPACNFEAEEGATVAAQISNTAERRAFGSLQGWGAMNQNNDSSASSSSSNPCPICLQSINQEAYLDRCFHKFCYDCIAHWSKWVTHQARHSNSSLQCPLCKVENFSIIHGCDGDSFQQHYISQDLKKGFSFSEAHRYRIKCYYIEPGVIYDKFNIIQYWKTRKYLQPNRWLQSWLRREIQALVKEEDVDIIVHHIHGVVESFLRRNEREHSKRTPEQKREEFKALVSEAARHFLLGGTDRFIDEMELFLASGLNIQAYDEVYMQCLGLHATDVTGEPEDQTPQPSYLDLFVEDTDISD